MLEFLHFGVCSSEDEADTASVAGTEDEDEAEYATPRKNVERTPKASYVSYL